MTRLVGLFLQFFQQLLIGPIYLGTCKKKKRQIIIFIPCITDLPQQPKLKRKQNFCESAHNSPWDEDPLQESLCKPERKQCEPSKALGRNCHFLIVLLKRVRCGGKNSYPADKGSVPQPYPHAHCPIQSKGNFIHCLSPTEKGDAVMFSPWAEQPLTYALTDDIPERQVMQLSCCRKRRKVS